MIETLRKLNIILTLFLYTSFVVIFYGVILNVFDKGISYFFNGIQVEAYIHHTEKIYRRIHRAMSEYNTVKVYYTYEVKNTKYNGNDTMVVSKYDKKRTKIIYLKENPNESVLGLNFSLLYFIVPTIYITFFLLRYRKYKNRIYFNLGCITIHCTAFVLLLAILFLTIFHPMSIIDNISVIMTIAGASGSIPLLYLIYKNTIKYSLYKDGVPIEGLVQLNNGVRIDYEYMVEDNKYEGSDIMPKHVGDHFKKNDIIPLLYSLNKNGYSCIDL